MKSNKIFNIFLGILLILTTVSLVSANTWNSSLENGLFAYYNFSSLNESAYGGTRNLINGNGTPIFVNNATTFDANSGYVSTESEAWNVTDQDHFGFNDTAGINMTFGGWIRRPAASGGTLFAGKGGSGGAGWDIIYGDANVFSVRALDDDGLLQTTSVIGYNAWYHIMVSRNDSHTCIWVNGTQNVCDVSALAGNNTHPFQFGGVTPSDTFMTGYLDEWGFWNRTLLPAEVSALFGEGAGISRDSASINLLNPPSNFKYHRNNITFNGTIINLEGITNVTLIIDGVNNFTIDTGNVTTFDFNYTVNVSYGSHTWDISGRDEQNNLVSSFEGTRGFNISISENSQTFNASTTETSSEGFIINLTYNSNDWTSITAKLNYDGVNYTATQVGTGDNILFTRSIDIPGNTGEIPFFWYFTLVDTDNILSITESNTQTVNTIGMSFCNSTAVPYINFTIYNATNPFPLINGTFKSSWRFRSLSGNGSTNGNFSFEDVSENNRSFAFCFLDQNADYIISADIEIDGSNSAKNFHYLTNLTVTNKTNNISLYLLDDGLATLTVLEVEDDTQKSIADVLINIQFYDIGTDTFYTVGMAKTSSLGSDLAYLNWYDSLYKFVLVKDGSTVYQTSPYKISSTPQTFVISSSLIDTYSKFRDFDYSLIFNNITKNFVLTFTKPSGDVDSACLRVIKRNSTNEYTICDVCETSSSATLYCNINPHNNGTYFASFYATGSLSLIDTLTWIEGISNEIYEEIGRINGAIYAIILTGVTFAFFLFSPVLGVLSLMFGMIGSLLLGFLPWTNAGAYIGLFIIGGAVIWLLKK